MNQSDCLCRTRLYTRCKYTATGFFVRRMNFSWISSELVYALMSSFIDTTKHRFYKNAIYTFNAVLLSISKTIDGVATSYSWIFQSIRLQCIRCMVYDKGQWARNEQQSVRRIKRKLEYPYTAKIRKCPINRFFFRLWIKWKCIISNEYTLMHYWFVYHMVYVWI